jgi:prepilin peptidase CpaA
MPLQLDLAPVAGFIALMATAAVEDIRRLVIPNGVVVGLCFLWPFHLATAPDATMAAVMTSIGCAVSVFFAGALLFSRGLIGGGDVKLLAAATLWAGPGGTLPLLALMGLLGGLLGLFVLSPICPDFAGFRRRLPLGPSEVATGHTNPVVVPYGAAIAAAALIVTIPPSFS